MNRAALKFLIFLFLIACSPVRKVATYQKQDANWTPYETFNYLDISFPAATDFPGSEREIKVLKAAISREMGLRGFLKTKSPHLLINIGITIRDRKTTRETTIRDAPIYIGQRNYQWESEEIVVEEYQEGMVTIDMIDAKTDQLIWQSVIAGILTANDKKMDDRIMKGIEIAFEDFPVE